MKSILLLLLICLIITGFLAVFYWIPRHLFVVSFHKDAATVKTLPCFHLFPQQEMPLPHPVCPIRKGTSRWIIIFGTHVIRKKNLLLAQKPGISFLLYLHKTPRKWTAGLCIIHVKKKPAFFQHSLMAHALGGMENRYSYCNCLEGLEQSIKRNLPFLETDLILASDQQLVCSHGWNPKSYRLIGVPYPKENPVMTCQEFLNTKIHGKFTSIRAETVADAMKKSRKLLVELDLRTLEREDAVLTARKILDVFERRTDLLNRLLIQVGSPEMYEGIHSVYPFANYQYFVHKAELPDIASIISYCQTNKILSIALKDTYYSKEILRFAHSMGIFVLVYTIDDAQKARQLLAEGVDTICSNFLLPEQL